MAPCCHLSPIVHRRPPRQLAHDDAGPAADLEHALARLDPGTLVFLLYQKGRDSRIFQAQDRAIVLR
jgi:hypothetical protein